MTVPDSCDALCDYLSRDINVVALVGSRFYPGELPKSEAGSMPRAAIVVRWSGGPGERNGLHTPRVDVDCYGATPKEARLVYLAVFAALRSLSRQVHAMMLLHSAVQSSGPIPTRAAEVADWPMVWSSWNVTAGDEQCV
jgi:hypothetical protein